MGTGSTPPSPDRTPGKNAKLELDRSLLGNIRHRDAVREIPTDDRAAVLEKIAKTSKKRSRPSQNKNADVRNGALPT